MRVLEKNYKKDEFLPTLLDLLRPHMLPKTKKDQDVVGQRIQNSIMGREQDYGVKGKLSPPSPFVSFLYQFLKLYSETSRSLENMHMISLFIKQYPKYRSYSKYGITETRYLKYHVENYLNETYIFEVRMGAFLKRIRKHCQKRNLKRDIQKIDQLLSNLKIALENVNKVRGSHVHIARYSDQEIDQLESLELFSKESSQFGDFHKLMKKLAYRKIRQSWFKRITKNNEDLDKIYHDILAQIKPVLFENLLPFYK